MSPVWMAVGESATATTNRITCAAMLPTSASSPPAATADARSMPWSCRNRTWAASPPTAGTARFENDIESWSSAVRISGRLIGTHPMSENAVAKLVRNETMSATASHPQSAPVIVFQNSSGSPIWLNSANTAISVPTAMSRLVVLTR